MLATRLFLFLLLFGLPLHGGAAVSADDLPGDTVWYLYADLDLMRTAESGNGFSEWFNAEIAADIREETGIDLSSEVNSITAYSDASNGTVILIDGPVTKETQDKLLALAAMRGYVDTREYDGKTYYFVGDDGDSGSSGRDPFDDLDDSTYFSFGISHKAIITSSENQLKALLDNGGRIVGSRSHDGALFVLTADMSFVQAGLRTNSLADEDDDDGWESNILRNTEQVAILIAERSGQIAIEAQLKSKDPKIAASIGAIINGLISLQAFNSELGPEVQSLIENTRVEVNGNVLTINTVIDPALVAEMLND
ncbi:MAG: hypothetical protein E2O53_03505 [Gammaproteobacteria bacterium]|nr:MAG: hypothetical protein E2O53_03505 [Gammaproteobacteria bacterium]